MQIFESVRMAFTSIGANKLRASLTLLSISIGVFAIVGVAAAVGALEAKVDDQLASLGRNSFIIQQFPVMSFGNGSRFRNRQDITLRQGLDLKRRLTSAENVSMTSWINGAVVKYESEKTDPDITIIGGDESFLAIEDYTLEEGRGLDPQDVQLRSDVAVIGADLKNRFFRNTSAVGKVIGLNGHRYTVIGTLAAKGAVFGQSQDDRVLVPITSSAKYFFDEWGTSIGITVRAPSVAALEETMGQAAGIMRAIRHVELGQENDFEMITNESISETFGGLTKYISWFGLVCGCISLAAAGVGIMNIMLVSVKERTREIGIRKAVGATSTAILMQFIVEAVTLCQLGALIGIIIGLLAGVMTSALVNVSPPIPWTWLSISIGACTVIGLAFGIYPAWRAAKLDPIDALRYE